MSELTVAQQRQISDLTAWYAVHKSPTLSSFVEGSHLS